MREERRCRMVVPFASRSLICLDAADAAFRPNPKGKAACGRIASLSLADWYGPTALATPSTASRNRSFALKFQGSSPGYPRASRSMSARLRSTPQRYPHSEPSVRITR